MTLRIFTTRIRISILTEGGVKSERKRPFPLNSQIPLSAYFPCNIAVNLCHSSSTFFEQRYEGRTSSPTAPPLCLLRPCASRPTSYGASWLCDSAPRAP